MLIELADTIYMILFFSLCPALLVLCLVLDRTWPCASGPAHKGRRPIPGSRPGFSLMVRFAR